MGTSREEQLEQALLEYVERFGPTASVRELFRQDGVKQARESSELIKYGSHMKNADMPEQGQEISSNPSTEAQ